MKKTRFLRIIIVTLGLLTLTNQIYNYLYIKQLEKKYGEIISQKTLDISSFEIITREVFDIQHALLQLAIDNTRKEIWIKEITTSENTIDQQYKILISRTSIVKEKKFALIAKNKFDDYRKIYNSKIHLLVDRKTNYDSSIREMSDIRPYYESCINAQEKQTEFLRTRAESISDKLTFTTNRTSIILLGLGILPFVIVICAILVSFIIIIWMGTTMNWFRTEE